MRRFLLALFLFSTLFFGVQGLSHAATNAPESTKLQPHTEASLLIADRLPSVIAAEHLVEVPELVALVPSRLRLRAITPLLSRNELPAVVATRSQTERGPASLRDPPAHVRATTSL